MLCWRWIVAKSNDNQLAPVEGYWAAPWDDGDDPRIIEAVGEIALYWHIEGDIHRRWLLDRVLRILLGEDDGRYEKVVAYICEGEDGPHTHEYDPGVPP